jgi:hypothetical protein
MEEKMRKGSWVLIGMIALLLVSMGCAGPSRLEMDYGTSVKLSKFGQILNPEAAKNLAPVSGLDGQAGEAIMFRYHKGFEEPSPPPVYMFNVGSISPK